MGTKVRFLLATLAGALALTPMPALAAGSFDWFAFTGRAALGLTVAICCALIGFWLGRIDGLRRRDLLQAAAEGMPHARQIIDPAGRVVYTNSAFHRMFGPASISLADAMVGELAGDEEAAGRLTRLAANAAAGLSGHAEIKVRGPSGKVEWRLIAASPLAGEPGYVLWRVEDITPRRQMEQVIRQEQERFSDLMERAPIGFYSVDGDGRFLFVNQTLAEWLGLQPEEVASRDLRLHDIVADHLPPGTPPHDPFGGALRQGTGEVRLRGRQNRVIEAYITQDVVQTEGGGGLRTRSVVYDLTRQREWEKALHVSVQRFQRFFEEAPLGIVLLDPEGRISECNRAFRKMIGKGRDNPVGTPLADLVTPDNHPAVIERLRLVSEHAGEAAPLDVRLNGVGELVVSLYLARLEDERGITSGFIGHLIDTTEQKRLEIQFAQSQKMQAVGQLAGGIAHDFNNLLTAMIGFCDLLLLRHRPGDQSFADIMQIKQNANRAANLVRQLLAFSRQQTLQPRVLNISDALAELSHLLRRLIGENIELKMVHGRELGLIKVDQGQLEQVIINLAVNARDAMAQGGTLTIRTSNVTTSGTIRRGAEIMPPGTYVRVEVIDTGTGIEPEIIDRIFEPFFSTKEVGAGTGLGLSTVYGIVRQTGGFVFVDSRPGEGAAFSIYLPVHGALQGVEAGKIAAQETVTSQDLTGIGTILLVEDEDAVRLFGARALRNKGYNVLEARSGEAALELINGRAEPIDLLITDVVMPRMDGPALIREVRAKLPHLKVVFISGYAEDSFRKRLDETTDIHFLPKPFSLKQLAAKVKEVLEGEVPAPGAEAAQRPVQPVEAERSVG